MASKKRRRRQPEQRTTAEAPPKRGTAGRSRDPARATKKEHREDARRRREQEVRRLRRRRTIIRVATISVLAVAGVVAIEVFGRSHSPGTPASYVSASPVDPTTLPGLQDGPLPWSSGGTQLGARLSAIGLAALPEEGKTLHIHQHLDVYVDGRHVTVPSQIGIAGGFSPIHTHDTSGIIHVEANTRGPFTLGEFFDVWGVKLTPDCLGGYCNQGDKKLQVFVDGHQATGDPRQIELLKHQEIVVAYGTSAELPDPIPSSYAFPPLT